MILGEIQTHLRQLKNERERFMAAPLLDALKEALEAPWIDAVLASQIQQALAKFGEFQNWSAAQLRVGEGFLLLCAPGESVGRAVRWRSTSGAQELRATAECASALDGAWRGLLTTVASAGHSLPASFHRGAFQAPALSDESVDGASLGVSACAAWMSRAIDVRLPPDLASSAKVLSDGSLGVVEHLPAKLAALRVQWPAVTRVIVATAQPIPDASAAGFTILRCARLSEAFTHFGLSMSALDPLSIEGLLERANRYKTENSRSHGAEIWKQLSAEAWATGQALHQDPTERAVGERTLAWSALFALHAGDSASARDIVHAIEDPEDPSVAAWARVVRAASLIDFGDSGAAFTEADAAAHLAQSLPSEHRWICGHAQGTRGRALLHAGRHDEARVDLEATMAWFLSRKEPWEAARTSKDVATSLRLTDRATEALSVVDCALQWLDEAGSRREVFAWTRIFLLLERGRCLLALGRPAEALTDFEQVERAQSQDHDYPRLGALRGAVIAHRRLGRAEDSRSALARCVAVAEAIAPGRTHGRVAAIAAAEALADGDQDAAAYMRAAWERHFGALSDESLREALARQVY